MIPSVIRSTRPRIVGPGTWPAHGPPPRFVVDTAGRPLFMVELAVAPVLMAGVGTRTADNYFYGGDGENAFAAAAVAAGTSTGTGRGWRVPAAVWARLRRAPVVYYRVVTLDQRSGRCDLSVDDHHLDLLPRVVVQNPHRTLCRTESP